MPGLHTSPGRRPSYPPMHAPGRMSEDQAVSWSADTAPMSGASFDESVAAEAFTPIKTKQQQGPAPCTGRIAGRTLGLHPHTAGAAVAAATAAEHCRCIPTPPYAPLHPHTVGALAATAVAAAAGASVSTMQGEGGHGVAAESPLSPANERVAHLRQLAVLAPAHPHKPRSKRVAAMLGECALAAEWLPAGGLMSRLLDCCLLVRETSPAPCHACLMLQAAGSLACMS